MTRVTVNEAWSVLGVSPGSTEDEAKSAYRRLALSSHPDKAANRDEASIAASTAKFQRVSAAWETLQNHYHPPPPRPSPFGSGGGGGAPGFSFSSGGGAGFHFTGGGFGARGYPEEDEYSDFDEYDDYDSVDDDDEMPFYEFMFQNFFNGRSGGYGTGRDDYYRYRREQEPERRETPEEQAARMRKQREARLAADQRRAEDERLRRQRREREAAADALRTAERRKAKSDNKRHEAEAERERIAARAHEARLKSQVKRSAAFVAARAGRSAAVREAVWEDDVQASEGEWLAGVLRPRAYKEDHKETLLHLAATHGDVDLAFWLLDHGAVAEERDTKDCTFFHRALSKGSVPFIRRLLSDYPPHGAEHDAVTRPPQGETLLSLVVSSGNGDAVCLLLPHASVDQVAECWVWLDSLTADASIIALKAALTLKAGFKAPAITPPSTATRTTFETPTAPAPAVVAPKKRNKAKKAAPAPSPAPPPPAPEPIRAPQPSLATPSSSASPTKGANKRPPTSSVPSSSQPSPPPSEKAPETPATAGSPPKTKSGPPRRRRKPAAQPVA